MSKRQQRLNEVACSVFRVIETEEITLRQAKALIELAIAVNSSGVMVTREKSNPKDNFSYVVALADRRAEGASVEDATAAMIQLLRNERKYVVAQCLKSLEALDSLDPTRTAAPVAYDEGF